MVPPVSPAPIAMLVTVPTGVQPQPTPKYLHVLPTTHPDVDRLNVVPVSMIGPIAVYTVPPSSTPSANPAGTPLSLVHSTGLVGALTVPADCSSVPSESAPPCVHPISTCAEARQALGRPVRLIKYIAPTC